jgi:hypothetical protein
METISQAGAKFEVALRAVGEHNATIYSARI